MYRFLTFSLIALQLLLTTNAIASEKKDVIKPVLIASYKEDITGDGLKETIELKGILFSTDSNYYREIWTEITDKNTNEWNIVYKGGYDPRLQFYDLNHNGVRNIFFQSMINEDNKVYNNQLHTIKSQHLKGMTLPKQHYVKATFKEKFNIEILIAPDSKPIVVNVKNQMKDYIQQGIYNSKGKILKNNISATIKPIASYKPILISESKGYGLISAQPISGAPGTDQLGTIETTWYYENNSWVVLKTEWVPTN